VAKAESTRIRHIIAMSGAASCLLVALFGLVMIMYWHHVTGDWLDEHIFFWQPIGLGCVAGIFIFTRIVGHDI